MVTYGPFHQLIGLLIVPRDGNIRAISSTPRFTNCS